MSTSSGRWGTTSDDARYDRAVAGATSRLHIGLKITICLLFTEFFCAHACIAEERPTTGVAIPAFAPLDEIVFQFMDLSAAKAAVLAVSHHGEVIYSRGYGWADRRRRTPTQTNMTFRLASNTKPITATVVKSLIRSGELDPDLAVFPFLGLSPFDGELGDERLNNVTVSHLLDHQGGWDRDVTFDPMYRLKQIQQEMHLNKSPNSHRIIQYMLSQPIQFSPGERRAYSNFGYLVLGRVIEKTTGQDYVDVVHARVFESLGTTEVHLSGQGSGEVFYPNGNGFNMAARDSAGGLAASAPALCRFMHVYWINGEQRRPRDIVWHYHMGSMTNTTTALMEQRLDGIDYAVMFNARRNEHYEEDAAHLRSELNRVLDAQRDKIKGRVTD